MSITYHWDNEEKTVIMLTFDGKWEWIDYDRAIDEVYALVRSMPHTVDVISYMTPQVRLPRGNAVAHVKRAFFSRPPNMRKAVLIGSDLFGERIVAALLKVKGLFDVYPVAADVNEARQLIAELDAQQGAAPAAEPPAGSA